jgi:hypothetical protein
MFAKARKCGVGSVPHRLLYKGSEERAGDPARFRVVDRELDRDSLFCRFQNKAEALALVSGR